MGFILMVLLLSLDETLFGRCRFVSGEQNVVAAPWVGLENFAPRFRQPNIWPIFYVTNANGVVGLVLKLHGNFYDVRFHYIIPSLSFRHSLQSR